jgi:superfamily I DNA/RNA helicase
MSWLVPRYELTAEQIRAVELAPTEHRLVVGGPGSGKTQVLVHRAAHLRDHYHVPLSKMHLFVFNNVLKDYIRTALELLDIPEGSVTTLDGWCLEYHRRHIGQEPLRPGSGKRFWKSATQPDFPAVRAAVAAHATAGRRKLYDVVLVDEAQDLDETSFTLLRAISHHVTIFMDRKQQIYERGADERAVLKQLGLRKRNLALLEALRCSPYIVAIAAALVEDPEEGREMERQTRTVTLERETPLVYLSNDFEDEKRRLIELIQIRQRRGDSIGILLHQRRQVAGFAKGLAEAGLVVESQDRINFASDAPKLLTYHSAKGLTFDSILMPRLVPGSFHGLSCREVERLLFVGTSRAVKWAYFSTDAHRLFMPLARVIALADEGKVTVQGIRPQRNLLDDDSTPSETPSRGPFRPPTTSVVPSDDVLDIL